MDGQSLLISEHHEAKSGFMDGKSFFHFCEFRDEGGNQFASLNQVRNLDIFVGGMNVGVEMPNTGGYGGDAQKNF